MRSPEPERVARVAGRTHHIHLHSLVGTGRPGRPVSAWLDLHRLLHQRQGEQTGVQSTYRHPSRGYLAPEPQRRRSAFPTCYFPGGPREDPYYDARFAYFLPSNHLVVLAAVSLCFFPSGTESQRPRRMVHPRPCLVQTGTGLPPICRVSCHYSLIHSTYLYMRSRGCLEPPTPRRYRGFHPNKQARPD